MVVTRRQFLRSGLLGLSLGGSSALWSNVLLGCSSSGSARRLLPADDNGVRLQPGLRSRIVAQSSQPVLPGGYRWHAAPDGGSCFATADGGWIYVSNSEVSRGGGGVGALVFDAGGNITDAYSILRGSNRNCAGGATPWGSWLSCEEVAGGRVWECDPAGRQPAAVREAMGVFNHEAVAVDTRNGHLYMTEDMPDGCLYRFIPAGGSSGWPGAGLNLAAGRLEVALPDGTDRLKWQPLPDPQALGKATRYQLDGVRRFDGGEGIVYLPDQHALAFTSKGDSRVWRYEIASAALSLIYDASDSLTPILTGVDNITVDENGALYVAEDGGDLQVVVITADGSLYPLLQLEGHEASEITGVAFSPPGADGQRRLYFSSQRGRSGRSSDGLTFEISGVF